VRNVRLVIIWERNVNLVQGGIFHCRLVKIASAAEANAYDALITTPAQNAYPVIDWTLIHTNASPVP